tara:strand:+ start:2792 stop:3070 length:279 start_codon:yes stop_codon:yes gene_type:complete
MSSFLNQKKRESGMRQRMIAKKSVKKMYKIFDKLDVIATELIRSGIIITEDNVEFEASKYTDIRIGSLEKSMLLSKVHQVYEALLKENDGEE